MYVCSRGSGTRSAPALLLQQMSVLPWIAQVPCSQYDTVVLNDVQNWTKDELQLCSVLFGGHPNTTALVTPDKVRIRFMQAVWVK